MALAYSTYKIHFHERVSEERLAYTLKQLLSIIPGSIGHGVDTILGLSGLFGEKDNYYHGPFGAVLSIPLVLLGYLIGKITDIIVNTPATLGRAIDIFFSRFHPLFKEAMILGPGTYVTAFFYNIPTSLPLPKKMQGPFGFLLGLIPALIAHSVNVISSLIVCTTRFITDHICDGINAIYSAIGAKVFGKKPKSETTEDKPAHTEDTSKETKKPKIRRAADEEKEILASDPALEKLIKKKIDLFLVLGITLADYEADKTIVDRKFKEIAVYKHPDKVKLSVAADEYDDTATREEWELLSKAKEVLADEKKSNAYLHAIEKRWSHGFFKSSAAKPSAEKPTEKSLDIKKSVDTTIDTTTVSFRPTLSTLDDVD